MLELVEVFTKVVERRSLSAAAAELGVAKSTVSKKLSRLETELGARLLSRTTRSVSPTEVGQAFYERCVEIRDAMDEATLEVRELHDAVVGRIRVSAPVSLGLRYLTGAVTHFVAAHPRVSVEYELADRNVDIVSEAFDLAVRVGRLTDSSLVARKLAVSRFMVVASPSYLARAGRPTRPADLRDHECLLYSYQQTGPRWTFGSGDGAESVKVTGRFVSNYGDALLDAACMGLGVAMLPDFIVSEAVADGRVESVLDDACVRTIPIHAVFPPGRMLTRKVALLVDAVAAHLAGRLPGND